MVLSLEPMVLPFVGDEAEFATSESLPKAFEEISEVVTSVDAALGC